jgi:hypothetical protein
MREIEPLDYERKPPAPPRVWGLSRHVWLLIFGFCALVELGAEFATNGRINGWGDVLFTLFFAVLGIVALLNAIRALWRARARPGG